VLVAAASPDAAPSGGERAGRAPDLAELWQEPADLESRDLYLGPGGAALVPDPETDFRFRSEDTTGHTGGYEVTDSEGRVWDVKIGDESRPEIVASRLHWAIGYHQPVTYFVPRWRMRGGPVERPLPGRFRLESDHKKEGEWDWYENPFAGTRPHRGLLVLGVLLNGWDYTANNNRIYRRTSAREGRDGPERWFVVQDLGATLGKTRWPNGTIDDLEGFLSLGFVERVRDDGRVVFDYHGRHRALLRDVTAEDVVWTCRLLARLSDAQMDDAFRAAGYPSAKRRAYITKLEEKIRQGTSLPPPHGSLR